MGTHPIFESDFDCLTDMDRLLYSSLSSTGRKFLSTKIQSDLKQRSVEEKIQLFPISIAPTKAQINYAVIPISSIENDILKDYKQYNDRSIYVTGAFGTALSSALVFYFNYFSIKMFGNDWFKRKGSKPACFFIFCFITYIANSIRKDVVKLKLPELLKSEENLELLKYPQMAMTREDLYDKTFSIEDQIRYFKSHEDELEKRIMLLLESDTFFFTTWTEMNMKALSWDEIEKDQNISFISFKKYLENILDEINS